MKFIKLQSITRRKTHFGRNLTLIVLNEKISCYVKSYIHSFKPLWNGNRETNTMCLYREFWVMGSGGCAFYVYDSNKLEQLKNILICKNVSKYDHRKFSLAK